MSYRKSNKLLTSILITALLFLQWSTAHFHLGNTHTHADTAHRHTIAHQHQVINHHGDAIDVADSTLSHSDSHKVVELEPVCTKLHANQIPQLAVFTVSSPIHYPQSTVIVSSASSILSESFYNFTQYSTIRLRAPPTFS